MVQYLANRISLSRLPLGGLAYYAAIGDNLNIVVLCIVVALVTDFGDGKIARTYGTDNGIGIIIDTTVDKIFLVVLYSGILKVLPEYSFPLLYIVIKESIALTLSAVIIVYGFTNNKRSLIFSALRSTIIGKIGFVVSAFVVAMILTDTYTTLAQWTGAITIAIASINYIRVLPKLKIIPL